MALFDLPLDELTSYRPEREEPADFDEFWRSTLDENAEPVRVQAIPTASQLSSMITSYDLRFTGFGGHWINGWLLLPTTQAPNAPTVVQYMGYNGGRGLAHEWWTYPAAGFPTLVVEARGQGGGPGLGTTADPVGGTGGEVGGFLTRGIESEYTYYLRRVYIDAYRAIDAARANGVHDADRVVIAAGSQGAGIGLAVSGLREVDLALLDVPSLCHFRRATLISNAGSRAEIRDYLAGHRTSVEPVMRVLSYFDGMNFAARSRTSARFSVGLMDQVCPPSTVFAAYNHYRGEKDITVWTYNGHEGGGPFQVAENLRILAERFAS